MCDPIGPEASGEQEQALALARAEFRERLRFTLRQPD
jgi:hypothetical protein